MRNCKVVYDISLNCRFAIMKRSFLWQRLLGAAAMFHPGVASLHGMDADSASSDNSCSLDSEEEIIDPVQIPLFLI